MVPFFPNVLRCESTLFWRFPEVHHLNQRFGGEKDNEHRLGVGGRTFAELLN